MLRNLWPQLLPSEQVPIVDVVRLVLALLVGGNVDCCITQYLHIRDIVDSIPCEVTAWKPVYHSKQSVSSPVTVLQITLHASIMLGFVLLLALAGITQNYACRQDSFCDAHEAFNMLMHGHAHAFGFDRWDASLERLFTSLLKHL